MTKLILLVFSINFISCTTQTQKKSDKFELVEQFDYRITIVIGSETGGMGFESKYILDNSQIVGYDSTDTQFNLQKPFILYHISYELGPKPEKSKMTELTYLPVDTTQLLLSKKQSDTLFNLTRNFFKSIEFDNYDTSINGIISKPMLLHDSHANVELQYGDMTLIAYIHSIHNPNVRTNQSAALFDFVEKFRPVKNK